MTDVLRRKKVMPKIDMEEYLKLPFRQTNNMTQKLGAVIGGSDNRTKVTDIAAEPYNAIVRLLMNVNGVEYRGTGFMVGSDVMLTAGHNIYDHETNKYCDNIDVVDKNGDLYQVYDYQIDPRFESDSSDRYDWAVAKVAVKPGKSRPYMKFKRMDEGTSPKVTGADGELAGFPAEVRAVDTTDMYTETGEITSYVEAEKLLNYSIDTSGGNSGSPLIYRIDKTPYAIGIHVSGSSSGNTARAIDENISNIISSL